MKCYFMTRGDLSQLVVGRAAGVHERLRDDGQTRVTNMRLVDVEHEVWVFN